MREKNPGSRPFKFLDMHAYYPWIRSAFPSWRVRVEERTFANNIRDVNPVCLPEISAHHGDCDPEEPENWLELRRPRVHGGVSSVFCALPDTQHL